MVTPATTVAIPAHLDKNFFTEALNANGAKNIDIHDIQIVRNTTGGNYCSDIYRVQVKYCENAEETSIVAGDKPTKIANLLVKDLFEHLSGSSREHFTYTTLLPVMNDVLAKAGVERPMLSPKLYLARKSKGETHVFEDMNAAGYKLCDRLVGFNTAETKMVLKKLAYFHAASMIFMQQHPQIVAGMSGFFWKNNPHFHNFVKCLVDGNIKYVAPIVAKWPGYEEIAAKLLRNSGAEFERKFLAIFDKEDAAVRVIVHSDLWIKNILILENDDATDNVLDAVFIDYQACFEGSPAFDINNLFMTSVQLEVLRTQRDPLIEYYHNNLCQTLQKLNYTAFNIELPTLEQIHAELKRTEYLTYYDLVFAFPQTNLAEELALEMDYDGLFDPARIARNCADMFSNPRVLDTLKFVLKRLDDLGILD